MHSILLFLGIAALACLFSYRLAEKLPLPSLLIFILLGILFGVDGPIGISFDNLELTEIVCSCALLFIMYYGGFNTHLKSAKPVLGQAVIMASFGVALTAGITAVCLHYFLHLGWIESALVGSVVSSTDAASVFNILRSQNLSLKYKTDSLLEVESGSNDPMSYMLTCVFTSLAVGWSVSVSTMLLQQILIGAFCGIVLARLSIHFLEKVTWLMNQSETIFLIAIALIAYALPSILGGNGYLSVYLAGIILGNAEISHKRSIARFFSVITSIAQMVIFFMLGLLVCPRELPSVFFPAVIVFLVLTFIARPCASAVLLAYKKPSLQKIATISWSGFRGVASIVFSMYIILHGVNLPFNIFNLVFVVVLLSLLVQGSSLSFVAQKLNMVDTSTNVLKTFNDYSSEQEYVFVDLTLHRGHPWIGKKLVDIPIPNDMLTALIMRESKPYVPEDTFLLEENDSLVIAAPQFDDSLNLPLYELHIGEHHPYAHKQVKDASQKDSLVVLVKRQGSSFVPREETYLLPHDVAVVANQKAFAKKYKEQQNPKRSAFELQEKLKTKQNIGKQ